MISIKEALQIHSTVIAQHGGSNGIREMNLLESALSRPYQTFDGSELYPTAIEKAAAIIESVVKNHPFSDGNKRTGYVLCRLLLMGSGLDIKASLENKYKFVISISTGKIKYDDIKGWLETHTKPFG
jgi:death-on-curing protein